MARPKTKRDAIVRRLAIAIGEAKRQGSGFPAISAFLCQGELMAAAEGAWAEIEALARERDSGLSLGFPSEEQNNGDRV